MKKEMCADDSGKVLGPQRRNAEHRGVNLALQGGGAHGAFTWGVLDRFFEHDKIWIDAISGTSAGAMNAVVAAQGMTEDGPDGARRNLAEFWKAVSELGRHSPIQRSPWARLVGSWSLDTSPGYFMTSIMQRLASPYDLNPFDINPLRDLVDQFVDFDKVRGCGDMGIFISATNVETGRVKVFSGNEISLESVMASACLPNMFKSVKIDGGIYWDGGFMGNPPLFPFFHGSPSNDILIVQINPIERKGEPTSGPDIQNRINEITFNSALQHELRAIDFVRRLLDAGKLDPKEYRRMHMHILHGHDLMKDLDASSKLNSEWSFLQHLFEVGRASASKWLDEHFEKLGKQSSVNLRDMFQGLDVLPHA